MNRIEPVPLAAPIVFPVVVPIFMLPAAKNIPYQNADEELEYVKFLIVLPWTLLAVTVPAFR